MEFTIVASADSILEPMRGSLFPSKQEAMAFIERHLGVLCEPAEPLHITLTLPVDTPSTPEITLRRRGKLTRRNTAKSSS
jgi:hypothetical protein